MSWSIGYDNRWKRDIGWGVPAYCDFPGCGKTIDRGLAHVCCDEEPRGGEKGCGLYFCSEHMVYSVKLETFVCPRCKRGRAPYKPTPDHPDWIKHKLTDESWEEWRKLNPDEVAACVGIKVEGGESEPGEIHRGHQ